MQEFITSAISLRKYPQGDLDGRYTLFTERYGKMTAKAKSSRKITSKLAQHLEPGTRAKVRFIESPGTQIIDALKEESVLHSGVSLLDLHFLSMLLHEGQPEPDLWQMFEGRTFTWQAALAVLGWDPSNAICASCGIRHGAYFYLPRQEFFCEACIGKLPSKLRQSAVLSMNAPV